MDTILPEKGRGEINTFSSKEGKKLGTLNFFAKRGEKRERRVSDLRKNKRKGLFHPKNLPKKRG